MKSLVTPVHVLLAAIGTVPLHAAMTVENLGNYVSTPHEASQSPWFYVDIAIHGQLEDQQMPYPSPFRGMGVATEDDDGRYVWARFENNLAVYMGLLSQYNVVGATKAWYERYPEGSKLRVTSRGGGLQCMALGPETNQPPQPIGGSCVYVPVNPIDPTVSCSLTPAQLSYSFVASPTTLSGMTSTKSVTVTCTDVADVRLRMSVLTLAPGLTAHMTYNGAPLSTGVTVSASAVARPLPLVVTLAGTAPAGDYDTSAVLYMDIL